jgi:hypothetical protein
MMCSPPSLCTAAEEAPGEEVSQRRRRIVVAVLLLLWMLQETLQKLRLSVGNSILDEEDVVRGCAATIVVAVEFGREREGEESGRV